MTDSLAASYEHCRALHRAHGRTYYMATRPLPKWKRRHMHALYGFTRYTDEIVDRMDGATPAERAVRLHRWAGRSPPPWTALRSTTPRSPLRTVLAAYIAPCTNATTARRFTISTSEAGIAAIRLYPQPLVGLSEPPGGSLYALLLRQIKAAGLLERCTGYCVRRIAVTTALLAAGWPLSSWSATPGGSWRSRCSWRSCSPSCQIRRAVCRCLRGTCRSASSQPSITMRMRRSPA